MSLRATKHTFTGSTTSIGSYDSSKTNLGSLMVQNTGSNPEDKFVGPRPIAVTQPSLQLAVATTGTAATAFTSLYSTGTAALAGATVTGTGTTWTAAYVGKLIGFGSTNPASITAWYTIATRTSNTVITLANGTTGIILTAGSYVIADQTVTGASGASFGTDVIGMSIGFGSTNPAAITQWYRIMSRASSTSLTVSRVPGTISAGSYVIVTTMMYPHTITFSSTVDWIFLIENSTNAVAGRRIFLYEYNKTTSAYTWIGYINATLNTSTAHTIRGFRALRYLHTTGQASASGTAVTGYSTTWLDEGIAVGARIGFGSTDPTQISTWYVISAIGSETGLTISASAGTVAQGSYVIEELRFAITTSNATVASGGLFLVKGVNYTDFISGGTTIDASSGSTDNLKLVYWMSDAGTTTGTNVVTNQSPCGCAIATEVSKGLHYAYVLDGIGSTFMKVYRYNLRATGTITSGKMLMNLSYTTAGTVTVASGVVTGSGTAFASNMVGMRIGFGSTSPVTITTWYTIASYTSDTSITLTDLSVNIGASSSYIIDSADVVSTAPMLVTGTTVAMNNGRIGTLNHGPGAGEESLYFVTTTRIYRSAVSRIFAGNINWISDNRPEIPAASANAFPATSLLNSVEIVDACDRLVVLTTGANGIHHYITKYPAVGGEQFESLWGVDDKQQDLPSASANLVPHYNTGSQTASLWSENGIAHIIQHGYTANQCQMYSLPLSAHWTYAASTNQRVITPVMYTPNCTAFRRVLVTYLNRLGGGEFTLTPEPFELHYRTKGIYTDTGAWTPVGKDGDLSGLSGAPRIQFMIEFSTVGWYCIPARILDITVTYDDSVSTTDSHYQPSVAKTNVTNKQFVWRFATAFGGTVPTLRIRLYDALTGDLLVDDYTTGTGGTWEKSTDGTSWGAYDTTDKGNATTYIRYTPASLGDNIKVRAVLTQ